MRDAEAPSPSSIAAWGRRVNDGRARLTSEIRVEDESPLQSEGSRLVDELLVAYEELKVAEEELNVQTEELIASRALVDQERLRYRALFEQAPVAYLVTDQYSTIAHANRVASSLLGVAASGLLSKPLLVFVDPRQRRSLRIRLGNLDAKDIQTGLHLRLRLRNGRLRRVAASVGIVRSAGGAIEELRWLLVDETKRRRRERLVRSLNEQLKARVEERTAELQRAVEVQQELARAADAARGAAERASREKSELIAIVSHELRTPLAAISGYAELLALDIRGPLNDSQRADIQRIQQAQSHIIRLVEDLVGYSKLATGRLRFDITDVLVRDSVMGLVSFVRPQAAAKEIGVNVQTPDDDVVVKADEERLRQIVLNLLTNAIKFTPRGGHVSIAYGADEASAWIAITDDGIGIPPEKLEVVFEPYVQLVSGTTHETGWGLGLAISRDLARAMAGDLTVTSSPRHGTVFTLRLPRSTRMTADTQSD